MKYLKELSRSLIHLFFPHVCAGCGRDVQNEETELCMRCLQDLPHTGFEKYPGNPVEKIFRGRLPLAGATAGFYFTKGSLMQQLMHQLKYKGNKEIGLQLGRMLGKQLADCRRLEAEALIPLPLYPARERKRGYNQARVICDGMAEVLQVPVLDKAVTRPHHTTTQTKKKRIDRWENIEGKFVLDDPAILRNKRLLLVDDVITTGATLESCGNEILKAENVTLQVVCLCIATH